MVCSKLLGSFCLQELSCRLGWKLEARGLESWKLEAGSWLLEAEIWKLEAGG